MGRNSSRIANRRSVSEGHKAEIPAVIQSYTWNSNLIIWSSFNRLASSNNMSKSESDQEDNDDLNDNDWSYGAEKKSEHLSDCIVLRDERNLQVVT